ncbi:immunity protein Tsi6 family protein [Nannocystis sp. ILAH1]|uniref:immunity protein Tsi6 family protein n=1 Tax=unclassified Nannocystis TaxID=2627009 RepID=UPI002271E2BE|nr:MULTISPECIES: immunity protein Tsi6 family protein [unclassified Nannocystis]MCY0988728.1 immunity protein Tsi6 family protein [Nannocystis sp. ILAH1]MCY1072505.1 immunity protein Tsi6 family protein [Nannocystis sp. RBIL2]
MPDLMRIVSRDAFAQVLGEARARTQALDPSQSATLRRIADQLELMARTTARGRVPHEDDRARVDIGLIAAREFEETDPRYADQLQELDYTYRRYPLLPPGPPVRRRGVLQVWSGRETWHKLVLEPGVPRTVGTAKADFVVDADGAGSPQFQILWDGVCAQVQAIDPHRLTIDGQPGWHGELAHRGWMTAGATTFRFLVEDYSPPPGPVKPSDAARAALAELQPCSRAGRLYAIVDAARSDRALQLLEESVDAYASLYDGEQGRAYDDVAPYLVQLRADSGLLQRLVEEGWGDAWGIYVESARDFLAVRRHFRQFLMVEAEGEAHRLFFRYYDPRVMHAFAATITPEQRKEFLAGIDRIVFERPDTAALQTFSM